MSTLLEAWEEGLSRSLMEEHSRLLWWWSHRLSRLFGGRANDYIGTVYQDAIRKWKYQEDAKGKFSFLLGRGLVVHVIRTWLRHESESRECYYSTHKSVQNMSATDKAFAQYETPYYLYRIPPREDAWALDIVSCFESTEACWEFLVRGLKPRWKQILSLYYQEGRSLEFISAQLNVSKQAVWQSLQYAHKHLRKRAFEVECFAALFLQEVPDA